MFITPDMTLIAPGRKIMAPRLCSTSGMFSLTRYSRNADMMTSITPPKNMLGSSIQGFAFCSNAFVITGIRRANPENSPRCISMWWLAWWTMRMLCCCFPLFIRLLSYCLVITKAYR